MSLWNGIIRMAQGKPVFVAAEEETGKEADIPPEAVAPSQIVSRSEPKIFPEIQIEHCKSRMEGSDMEVTAWVTNQSAVEVELDKIMLLGRTFELDRILLPKEGREIRLYKGEVAKSDDDERARLQYKQRSNGDYFQADFTIEFDYDSDGFYTVEEFHSIHPVRDI